MKLRPNGLSQIQLAELSGIGLTTIKKIENGQYDNIVYGNLKQYRAVCAAPDIYYNFVKPDVLIKVLDLSVKELLEIHKNGLGEEVESSFRSINNPKRKPRFKRVFNTILLSHCITV